MTAETVFISNDRKPHFALITAVPGIAKALTGQDPVGWNARAITRIRLKDTPEMVVDLFFIPAVFGKYNSRAVSNVEDLCGRLRTYDLAVDLNELTALFRRGKTPKSDENRFYERYGSGSKLGDLEYRDFLRVILALTAIFSVVRGKVIRPRDITLLEYQWRRDTDNVPNINNFSVAENRISAQYALWAQIDAGKDGPLLDALDDDGRANILSEKDTLKAFGQDAFLSRTLVTSYGSDLADMVKGVVSPKNEPSFVSTAQDVLDHKRLVYGVTLDSECYRAEIAPLEQEFLRRIDAMDPPVNLVDQYRISNGPSNSTLHEDAEPSLAEALKERFPNAFAFLKFWDDLETHIDTNDMNRTVNGWYMSNSCLTMLVDAAAIGLKPKITSWSLPVLATNSVGLFPDYDTYLHGCGETIMAELGQVGVLGNIAAA